MRPPHDASTLAGWNGLPDRQRIQGRLRSTKVMLVLAAFAKCAVVGVGHQPMVVVLFSSEGSMRANFVFVRSKRHRCLPDSLLRSVTKVRRLYRWCQLFGLLGLDFGTLLGQDKAVSKWRTTSACSQGFLESQGLAYGTHHGVSTSTCKPT